MVLLLLRVCLLFFLANSQFYFQIQAYGEKQCTCGFASNKYEQMCCGGLDQVELKAKYLQGKYLGHRVSA